MKVKFLISEIWENLIQSLCVTKINNIGLLVLIFSVFVPGFSGCKKEKATTADWQNCYSCTAGDWIGWYTGTADYYNALTNTTHSGLTVSVRVEETATDYMSVYITVPNCYSASISGDFVSPYILSLGGTSSSIDAIMYKKDNQFRLTGNSKKFHHKVDSLVIEEVLNFETLKDQ